MLSIGDALQYNILSERYMRYKHIILCILLLHIFVLNGHTIELLAKNIISSEGSASLLNNNCGLGVNGELLYFYTVVNLGDSKGQRIIGDQEFGYDLKPAPYNKFPIKVSNAQGNESSIVGVIQLDQNACVFLLKKDENLYATCIFNRSTGKISERSAANPLRGCVFYGITALSDESYIIWGKANKKSIIMCFKKDGSKIWEKELEQGAPTCIKSAELFSRGSMIIADEQQTFSSKYGDGRVITKLRILDFSGNEIGSYEVQGKCVSLASMANESCLLYLDSSTSSLRSNDHIVCLRIEKGKLVSNWKAELTKGGGITFGARLKYTQSGRILFGAVHSGKIWLVELSKSGQILSNNTLPAEMTCTSLISLIEIGSKTFIVAASYDIFVINKRLNYQNFVLHKFRL